ncbi:MAG: flagellar biosynthesis anti-sigma factor FlgM [Ethanoligenens sp.]
MKVVRQMKIDGFQPHNIYASFSKEGKEEKSAQTSAEQTGSADRVEISAEAADLGEAARLSQKITDTSNETDRTERLAEIKKQVQGGTYRVSADKVAGSMLGRRIDRQV